MLKKRKIDQTDLETMPIIGVVTTGNTWLFIRQTGPIGSAQFEIFEEFDCSFVGDMENLKEMIAFCIVRLLKCLYNFSCSVG